MPLRFETIQEFNWDLDILIEELTLALFACKDAQDAEVQLRQAGELLGDYITVPGSGNQTVNFLLADTMTDQKNYWVGDRTNDPSDPYDTNF